MQELTDATFADAIAGDKPVLVDFSATWCGPCKRFAPTFERLGEKYKDTVTFCKADLDYCPKKSEEYSIEVVPTIVLFKNGAVKATKSGVFTEAFVEVWLRAELV